jgi:thioredoxin reductase (NADPH)
MTASACIDSATYEDWVTASSQEPVETQAAIVVICREPGAREILSRELCKRYGADYQIVVCDQSEQVGSWMRDLQTVGMPVAMVIGGVGGRDSDGIDVLAAVRRIDPTALRVAAVAWGDWASARSVFNAVTEGTVDHWVTRPEQAPAEEFHRSITEFLREWSSQRGEGFEAVRVIGKQWSARSQELRDLFGRHRVPMGFYDVASAQGSQVLRQLGLTSADLPVVELRFGSGQPALAAVSASSEGLRTLVIEHEAIGGQAGTSSMIRNYPGFSQGISGSKLAQETWRQAWTFGTTFLYMRRAESLSKTGSHYRLRLSDGSELATRTVVISTGATYRRLGIPRLEDLQGRGVFYGAAASEAPAMRGRNVFVAGGGNSAGQTALHMAKWANHVTVLVRATTLAESMSDYLIREIAATPNIDVSYHVQVADGTGADHLQSLVLRDTVSGARRSVPADALFILIGSLPRTHWLGDSIARDQWGFILTGPDLPADASAGWSHGRSALALETSLPGVFAAGDVRRGSVKRVASAVGEGAGTIPLVHRYLETTATAPAVAVA